MFRYIIVPEIIQKRVPIRILPLLGDMNEKYDKFSKKI